MDFSRRVYREKMKAAGMVYFEVRVKETDLGIGVDGESFHAGIPKVVEDHVLQQRCLLEDYIREDAGFLPASGPYLLPPGAPVIVRRMAWAGNRAGVGPMAAVAGAFAESVGFLLLPEVREVVVENGGDVFIKSSRSFRIGIFAGDSPFSGRLVLVVPPSPRVLGVCSSSWTVGPSISLGKADVVTIVADTVPLADAVATAAGNRIGKKEDFPEAVAFARSIVGVQGILAIMGDDMTAWGQIELETV